MYAFAERFERDQHKPLLSPTALKLAFSPWHLVALFLEREKGDAARRSLGRVIKAADGKDLPSRRFQVFLESGSTECVSVTGMLRI